MCFSISKMMNSRINNYSNIVITVPPELSIALFIKEHVIFTGTIFPSLIYSFIKFASSSFFWEASLNKSPHEK